MILTTTETICGKELETLGLVKGSTIQTVNAVRDIGAGLKTLVGGELTRYNEMMNDARALATKRMVGEAEAMGADAIVAVRYSSASVMQSAAEVMAYSLTENRPLSNRKGKPAGRIAACRCFLLPVLYSYMRWLVKWIRAESMCTQFLK